MMTKEFALEECRRIWYILSDNINFMKADVEGTKNYIFGCPCCQYVCEKLNHDGVEHGMHRSKCRLCPLKSLWGTKCDDNMRSPYTKWVRGHYNNNYDYLSLYAWQIAYAADTELMNIYLKEMNS